MSAFLYNRFWCGWCETCFVSLPIKIESLWKIKIKKWFKTLRNAIQFFLLRILIQIFFYFTFIISKHDHIQIPRCIFKIASKSRYYYYYILSHSNYLYPLIFHSFKRCFRINCKCFGCLWTFWNVFFLYIFSFPFRLYSTTSTQGNNNASTALATPRPKQNYMSDLSSPLIQVNIISFLN